MTAVVLHRSGTGTLPPCPEWLAGLGRDPVLVTDVPAPVSRRPAGYSEVRHVGRYASADAETTVLDLARHRTVTAVLALHPADQVRAGALRDALGLPGQTRDEALVLVDAVAAHALLGRPGVPVTERADVRRILDLYRAAHIWGYPLAVRRRRTPGGRSWPCSATRRGCARSPVAASPTAPSPPCPASWWSRTARKSGTRAPACRSPTRCRSAPDPGHPYVVEAVRRPGGAWRVDGVRYRPVTRGPRSAPRPPRPPAPWRWRDMSVLVLHQIGSLRGSPYHEWLDGHDGDVLLLTCAENLRLVAEELPPPGSGYAHAEALDGYDGSGLLEERALDLARERGVRHVVACHERDLERAAVLREILSLPGQRMDTVEPFRDKTLMKRIAADAGLAAAPGGRWSARPTSPPMPGGTASRWW
ncbi:hypothetical protein ACR6C2_38570 [Streptomyces sp. INA 01156]